MRPSDDVPEVQDDFGRPLAGDPLEVAELAAWIQTLSEAEIAALSESGAVNARYTVFLYHNGETPRSGDYLVTLARGGIPAGQVHQIDGGGDPDGTGHHLELLTHVVRPLVPAGAES